MEHQTKGRVNGSGNLNTYMNHKIIAAITKRIK
jgi:hypothetical protein